MCPRQVPHLLHCSPGHTPSPLNYQVNDSFDKYILSTTCHSPVDKVISFMSVDLPPSRASPFAQVAIETCMHPTLRLLRMPHLLGAQCPSTRHLLQALSEGPHHVEGTFCWLVNWPSFAMVGGADCSHRNGHLLWIFTPLTSWQYHHAQLSNVS